MDKILQEFIKQNPEIDLLCDTPKCKGSITVDSKKFFKLKVFTWECPKCKKTMELILKQYEKDLIKELKRGKKSLNRI